MSDASALPTLKGEIAARPVALELAMPLKSDSTAMRLPMTEAIKNAMTAAAAIKRRLRMKKRFNESGIRAS